MKNKELSYKVSFYSIIGIVVIIIYLACTSCVAQRRYPKYSSKNCHWDTNTYHSNMEKKHKVDQEEQP